MIALYEIHPCDCAIISTLLARVAQDATTEKPDGRWLLFIRRKCFWSVWSTRGRRFVWAPVAAVRFTTCRHSFCVQKTTTRRSHKLYLAKQPAFILWPVRTPRRASLARSCPKPTIVIDTDLTKLTYSISTNLYFALIAVILICLLHKHARYVRFGYLFFNCARSPTLRASSCSPMRMCRNLAKLFLAQKFRPFSNITRTTQAATRLVASNKYIFNFWDCCFARASRYAFVFANGYSICLMGRLSSFRSRCRPYHVKEKQTKYVNNFNKSEMSSVEYSTFHLRLSWLKVWMITKWINTFGMVQAAMMKWLRQFLSCGNTKWYRV